MEAISTPAPIENETFWRHHIQMLKTSTLTRANYCRQNGLNYYRFGYWLKKHFLNQNQSTQLIAVKLKTPSEPAMQSILCTLDLNGGHSLKIHDVKALSIILDKMR
jgi:hypothetical protein